jgi:hypothetical protein
MNIIFAVAYIPQIQCTYYEPHYACFVQEKRDSVMIKYKNMHEDMLKISLNFHKGISAESYSRTLDY